MALSWLSKLAIPLHAQRLGYARLALALCFAYPEVSPEMRAHPNCGKHAALTIAQHFAVESIQAALDIKCGSVHGLVSG